MLELNGRLKHKSLIKEGTSEYGKWRVVQFTIEKTHLGEKKLIPFTAKGKWAEFIDSTPIKERIRIHFVPESFFSTKTNRFYVELRVLRVEKYVPKQRYNFSVDGESYMQQDVDKTIKPDLQLDFKETEDGQK